MSIVKLTNDQLEQKLKFKDEYFSAGNAASWSKLDANANVEQKNIATFAAELNKSENLQFNRYDLYKRISELFWKEQADKYLEQLETGVLNGNNNIDTLQEIERYHTDLRSRTHAFIKEKDVSKKNYAFIGMWVVGLQAGCAFLLGFKAFQAGFSQSPVGLIFGLPFLLIETWVFVSFFRDYWDDDIMSVKKSK